MTNDFMLFALYLVVLMILAWPLGKYMAKVFMLDKTAFDPLFRPIEKLIYRLSGVNPEQEMTWKHYAVAVVAFNMLGAVMVFLIEVTQGLLPWNPEGLIKVAPWHLALNTAVSFMTNTNWQAYTGETTMSYFTQMTALTVQNFLSAATGLAVAVALIRGLTRKKVDTIGNFWVDLVRSIVWVLLPICLIYGLMLVQQVPSKIFSTTLQ
jgi:K+-transporting ATPase ATPase A chain